VSGNGKILAGLKVCEVVVMAKTAEIVIGWGNSSGTAAKKTIRPRPDDSSDSDSASSSSSKAVPIGRRVSREEYRKIKEAARQGVPIESQTQTDS